MAEDNRRVRVPQAADPNPSLLLEDEGGSLLKILSRVRSALERERAEAPALVDELLALTPEEQGERLRQEPRFHNWGLCELLLAQSVQSAAKGTDPEEAVGLAALVLAAADLLDRSRHAPPVVEDLKARAWAAAGEACVQRGDLAAAEDALRSAASCLAQGTGDLLVEGRLLEFEASLRRHQGRTGEAAALFKMAAARYREIGESELLARAVAARNEILGNKPAPTA